MADIIDTYLNLTVFAFIGVLFWLYYKDVPKKNGIEKQTDKEKDK